MTKKVLEVSNLVVKYGNILVLEKVSLSVNENEIVALAGPNGSGKTTILNTIAGIKEAEEGEINFLGKNIIGLPARDRRKLGIACVPQENNVFSRMSVKKNLDVATHLLEKKARARSIDYVYELFPVLKERERQIAGSLSGGEQGMLAVAMGLAIDPLLLLVDEASTGLAPKLVSKLFNRLKRIKSESNKSILVAEQNIGILEITDRVYGLGGKKIRFQEKAENLDKDLIKELYLGGS